MTTTVKLDKGTFQYIESELHNYNDRCKELYNLRQSVDSKTPDENVGGGRSSRISDPTADTVIRMATHKRLLHLQNLIDAIDTVVERLPTEKQRLVKIRYWTKPQTLTWDGIADKLHVSNRTARYWNSEIIYAIAERLGMK